MKMSPKEKLKLFENKYARLQSSSLIRFMTDSGWKFSFDFETNAPSLDAVLPDLEFIESYVLNLRFFIQDNEPISLRNLSEVYKTHCHDKKIRNKFDELRKVFNSELDREWSFKFNKKNLTHREIFMGFIYAEIAHSKVENHIIFHRLREHPFGYQLALNSFLNCIDFIHNILTLIHHLNKQFMANLKTE